MNHPNTSFATDSMSPSLQRALAISCAEHWDTVERNDVSDLSVCHRQHFYDRGLPEHLGVSRTNAKMIVSLYHVYDCSLCLHHGSSCHGCNRSIHSQRSKCLVCICFFHFIWAASLALRGCSSGESALQIMFCSFRHWGSCAESSRGRNENNVVIVHHACVVHCLVHVKVIKSRS